METDLFPDSLPKPCAHTDTKVTPTPHLKHYAREDCIRCGKFLRWLPKPETLENHDLNHEKIRLLSAVKSLSDWEKGFLLSLAKQGRNFSPNQQTKLDQLFNKYGL